LATIDTILYWYGIPKNVSPIKKFHTKGCLTLNPKLNGDIWVPLLSLSLGSHTPNFWIYILSPFMPIANMGSMHTKTNIFTNNWFVIN
jgi:hypothetical protein